MEISDTFMILRSSQCRKFKLSFYHKLESLKFLNPRFFREQNTESPTRSFVLLITYIREHIAARLYFDKSIHSHVYLHV